MNTKNELIEALRLFGYAALDLHDVWNKAIEENVIDGIEALAEYPSGWSSFDEELVKILKFRIHSTVLLMDDDALFDKDPERVVVDAK